MQYDNTGARPPTSRVMVVTHGHGVDEVADPIDQASSLMAAWVDWASVGAYTCMGGGNSSSCMSWLSGSSSSMRDAIREEQRALRRSLRQLDRQLAALTNELNQGKQRVKRLAQDNKLEQAMRAASELHRNKLAYRRVGQHRDNVNVLAQRIQEQMDSSTVDRGLLALTRIMQHRNASMDPARFAHMLQRYDTLKGQEELRDEMFDEFYHDESDRDLVRDEQSRESVDDAVREIFNDLGLDHLLPSAPDSSLGKPTSSLSNTERVAQAMLDDAATDVAAVDKIGADLEARLAKLRKSNTSSEDKSEK